MYFGGIWKVLGTLLLNNDGILGYLGNQVMCLGAFGGILRIMLSI